MSNPTTQPDTTKPPSCTERLEAIGIEAICNRIQDGESDGEIAASIGMSKSTVNNWLNLDENIIQSARAREQSAESWLDKGLATISTALPKDGGIDSSAARAYAQECARRAAIRNPKYRDKSETAITGADGGAVKVEDVSTLTIARKMAMALAAAHAQLVADNADKKAE